MSDFPNFDRFTEPRLDDLREALAIYPLQSGRDRTPDDWLDCMQDQNPAGLAALHRAFAAFLDANESSDQPDELWFRDFVWLLGHRLFAVDTIQFHEAEAHTS